MIDAEHCPALGELPRCPHCGSIARPSVYIFNDYDWLEQRSREQSHRLENWLQEVERLLVIEIGAGTPIPTAREFSHRLAFELDAPVIRINPHDPTIYGHVRYASLPMDRLHHSLLKKLPLN